MDLINYLVHRLDKLVDVLLSVTSRTTLDKVLELSLNTPATRWVRQLERTQEVVGLLEVWSNGVDLVDQVLDRNNTVFAELSLNDGVVGKSNPLLVNLTVTSLVQELSNGRQRWVTVSDVWLSKLQQLRGSLGHSNKDTGVDLEQSKKLQNLSWFRSNLGNTLDSDNENQFVLSLNVERAVSLGLTLGINQSTLSLKVLLSVSSGSVKDGLSLLLVSSFSGLLFGGDLLSRFGLSLVLFDQRFWLWDSDG